jgi:HD superfamily phosphohydrolase
MLCKENNFKEPEKFNRPEVFRDPIYGYIYLDYIFLEKLINTKVFQRLRRIKQLSFVNVVFHGAEHSRFSHSLGVYELSRRFLETHKFQLSEEIFSLRNKLILLTASLLHDIGHGAYSHMFERIFKTNHEEKTAQIIVHNKEIVTILDSIDKCFKKDVASVIKKEKDNEFQLIQQLLTSQLDFDRLDYLKRDSFFTGVSYGYIDTERLMRIIHIEKHDQKYQIVFRKNGISAIENYLINRYHMYKQVYYHPKIKGYSIILEKIFIRIQKLILENYSFKSNFIVVFKDFLESKQNLNKSLEIYLKIDDFYVNSLIVGLQDDKDVILANLCQDFLNRRIWKYKEYNDKNKEIINQIQQHYCFNNEYYTYEDNSIIQDAYGEYENNIGEQIFISSNDSLNNKIQPLSCESTIISSLMDGVMQKDDRKFFYYRKY